MLQVMQRCQKHTFLGFYSFFAIFSFFFKNRVKNWVAKDFMKSGLDLSSRCLDFFWVFFVFFTFFLFDPFCSWIFNFLCFWVFHLICFTLLLFLGCFSGRIRIFGLVYGQTKNFGSTRFVQEFLIFSTHIIPD
jgi:hypothetical protein